MAGCMWSVAKIGRVMGGSGVGEGGVYAEDD